MKCEVCVCECVKMAFFKQLRLLLKHKILLRRRQPVISKFVHLSQSFPFLSFRTRFCSFNIYLTNWHVTCPFVATKTPHLPIAAHTMTTTLAWYCLQTTLFLELFWPAIVFLAILIVRWQFPATFRQTCKLCYIPIDDALHSNFNISFFSILPSLFLFLTTFHFNHYHPIDTFAIIYKKKPMETETLLQVITMPKHCHQPVS